MNEFVTTSVTTDDGVRLHVQKLGTGPITVLIPNGTYYLNDLQSLADDFTLIAYDPRNRGMSDRVTDGENDAKPLGDIHSDLEDIEAVRRHFEIEKLNLIGHSYVGLMVALYGMKYPANVNRIIQIGPMPPAAGRQYPPSLQNDDGKMAEVFEKIGHLQREAGAANPVEFCRKFWTLMREVFVADAANAHRVDWGRCEMPNELNFMKYWVENLAPSILRLRITPELFARLTCPVLTIHGTKDRNAPYGGGREWAWRLPEARLLSVTGVCHAPWIEAPGTVLPAIRDFFRGVWPKGVELVTELGPSAFGA